MTRTAAVAADGRTARPPPGWWGELVRGTPGGPLWTVPARDTYLASLDLIPPLCPPFIFPLSSPSQEVVSSFAGRGASALIGGNHRDVRSMAMSSRLPVAPKVDDAVPRR